MFGPAARALSLVLFLVAIGVCGCGSAATRAGSGVVPWLNRALPLYHLPVLKPIRYPTAAPPCRAEQVRVSQGRRGAGLGNELEELVFTNTGAKPCLLRGYPAISAETPSGGRRMLRPQRGGTYSGQLVPADLAASGHVFLDLATSSGCQGGTRPHIRYRNLIFSLPHGGSVRASRVAIIDICGVSISTFELPERLPQPAPGTAGMLQARLRLPARVRAGTDLSYTVTLVNPTKRTVVFRRCPGYTQALFQPAGLAARRSFALNCDGVHAIPAHASVRYAMRLAVPKRAAAGFAKFAWMLDTPYGPSTGRMVQITND